MVKITSLQSRVLDYIIRHIDEQGVPPTLREIASTFEWKAVGSAQDVIAALRRKGYLELSSAGRARQTIPTHEAYQLLRFGHTDDHIDVKRNPGSRGARRVQTRWDEDDRVPDFARGRAAQVEGSLGVRVPLLGYVQAGHPQEAIARADSTVVLPRHPRMKENRLFYALEVEGYSMIQAGLVPGDLLLVEADNTARNGEIVVAAVGDAQEVTVKRFVQLGSPHYREALARSAWANASREEWPHALLVPENADFEPIAFGRTECDRILGLVRSLYRSQVQ
jgi:repressor LexA